MRDIFNQTNWPTMWNDAMRASKRARTEEALQEQEWYQELFDEEGEPATDELISVQGEFVFRVDANENSVDACDVDGDTVGRLVLMEGSDCNYWLNEVTVPSEFQHRGIGTELVRLAVNHLEDFFIPGVQESDEYEFSLSDGGANLINTCLRRGYVRDDMIMFPPDVPCTEGVDVDPGLIIGFGRIGDIYTARTREENMQNHSPPPSP